MKKVSNTTWALIKFSKQENSDFSFVGVKTFLQDIYHPNMKLHDVVGILVNSLQEVLDEDRFKVHYGPGIIKKVILAPIDRMFFEPEPKSILELYEFIIKEILYAMQFSTVNWCKDKF